MRKEQLTRELLDDNKISVDWDENNQPIIKQEYIPNDNHDTSHIWNVIRTQHNITRKHKYGKDMTYKCVFIKLYGKFIEVTVQNLVWVYFKGNIERFEDVDHINSNPLDNSLNNLKKVSRKENLDKRDTRFRNQYDYFNYKEFGELYIELRDLWRRTKKHNENFKKWYKRTAQ